MLSLYTELQVEIPVPLSLAKLRALQWCLAAVDLAHCPQLMQEPAGPVDLQDLTLPGFPLRLGGTWLVAFLH